MNILKFLINFFLVSLMLGGAFFIYRRFTKKAQPASWYKTAKPQKRNIKHEIYTSGVLEIKNYMKIGSQLLFIIKDVFVKENQHVKKGMVLAVVEISKNDKDIRLAQENLAKAEHELYYQQENFKRKQELYRANQLSKNEYEKIKSEYEKARADRNARKVDLEKAQLEYRYTNIVAPDDGIVTAVYATKGLAVYADITSVLFEIAHNITEMKATLDIDESEVGYVKPGQRVKLTVNTFPDQPIEATIKELSFIPKNDTPNNKDAAKFYKATVEIDNKDQRLRPGMMVTAKMVVEEAKDALSISGFSFQFDWNVLEKIAKLIGYAYKPLSKEQKKSFKQTNVNQKVKYVWTVENKTFTQKGIILGITDNNHWQVIKGLTEQDHVITHIQETDAMEKLYKAWFKGAL